ncbi:hypothetical protein HZY86_03295 [Aerococcaceae bacterium DSM 111020]|nr:hypothetical protein [Aerococcaceae bacterium DSM 111020]
MLKIKYALNDPQSMAQDGDSILKSLQNVKIPIIDLIVRESIQNSLDAALGNKEHVEFDFYHGKFQNKDLASQLEEAEESLLNNFSKEEKFLAFSDKNTSGLTGSYVGKTKEEIKQSNFHKLIFSLGKNQEQEGAGGSWGLGKTSFFRIGNGIVIYYTRIKTRSGYEERLIVSLIENPKNKKRILPKNERGIAWWGEYQDSVHILPITNPMFIKKFLNIFGLESYKDDETGTMIIIPYLNSSYKKKSVDEKKYYWDEDLDEQLKLAIQRWYMPRIMNNRYAKTLNQAYLIARVNGDVIMPGINTEEVFNVFRALYDSALTGKIAENNFYNIQLSEVKFPRLITQKSNAIAGRVAFCQVSKEQLKMQPPYNQENPLALIGAEDPSLGEKFNSKIMAYSRQPGMVVRYAIDDDWMPKGSIQEENKLLLGFYVPVSKRELHDKLKKQGFDTMESYLRSIETADHAIWEDQDGINIVIRTKKATAKLVQDALNKEENTKQGDATSRLSRKYGAMLIPFRQGSRGVRPRNKPVTNNSSKKSQRGRSSFSILKTNPLEKNAIVLNLKFLLPGSSKSTLSLRVKSSDRQISYDEWQRTMGDSLDFPLTISDFKLTDDIQNEFESDKVVLENNSPDSLEIEGVLRLQVNSNEYSPILMIGSQLK